MRAVLDAYRAAEETEPGSPQRVEAERKLENAKRRMASAERDWDATPEGLRNLARTLQDAPDDEQIRNRYTYGYYTRLQQHQHHDVLADKPARTSLGLMVDGTEWDATGHPVPEPSPVSSDRWAVAAASVGFPTERFDRRAWATEQGDTDDVLSRDDLGRFGTDTMTDAMIARKEARNTPGGGLVQKAFDDELVWQRAGRVARAAQAELPDVEHVQFAEQGGVLRVTGYTDRSNIHHPITDPARQCPNLSTEITAIRPDDLGGWRAENVQAVGGGYQFMPRTARALRPTAGSPTERRARDLRAAMVDRAEAFGAAQTDARTRLTILAGPEAATRPTAELAHDLRTQNFTDEEGSAAAAILFRYVARRHR